MKSMNGRNKDKLTSILNLKLNKQTFHVNKKFEWQDASEHPS
jgi:hypothetical protein